MDNEIKLRFIYFDLVTRHYTSGQYSNILKCQKARRKLVRGNQDFTIIRLIMQIKTVVVFLFSNGTMKGYYP